MQASPEVSGIAALAIYESLLVVLNDSNILPEREIIEVLQDTAAAHENASPSDGIEAAHKAVTKRIKKIIDGGNSVRNHVDCGGET